MLSITPHNLRWLTVEAPHCDLCAHGGVLVSRDNDVLVDHRAENWTLSAAALMLLRTLSCDHTAAQRVGEHLFPCCGHAMYKQSASDDVLIIGCPNGLDWAVTHRGDVVELDFHQQRVAIPESEWRSAVLSFSEAVSAFYDSSAPKTPGDEDAEGYETFRAEWKRRYDAAKRAA